MRFSLNILKIKSSGVFFVLVCVVVVGLATFSQNILNIEAEGTDAALVGYAWSDNIGWVSFSCTNDDSCGSADYGVTFNSVTGKLGGYAWSDTIGWVSFEDADTADCPMSGINCAPRIEDDQLEGFVRALAPVTYSESYENGGWDGWIHLSGVSYDSNTNEFSGYAWGSDVVGWVHFDPDVDKPVMLVGSQAPDVTLSVDPLEVIKGEDTTLTWETTGAVSCDASGAWSGAKDPAESAPQSQVISNIQETADYTLTCESIGGSSASSTVHVLVRTENFGLNLNKGTVQMFTSDTASPSTTLTLVTDGGFSSDVSLTASFVTAPVTPGVTIVAPSSISGGEGKNIYIDTPNGIEPGIYQVQVTGTATIDGSSVVRTTSFTIYVEKDPIDYEDF